MQPNTELAATSSIDICTRVRSTQLFGPRGQGWLSSFVPDYLCCGLKLVVTEDQLHKNHEPSSRSSIVQHDQTQRFCRLPDTGQRHSSCPPSGPWFRRAALALVKRHTHTYSRMHVESCPRERRLLADKRINIVLESSPLNVQIKESSSPCTAGALGGPQVSRFTSFSRSTSVVHPPTR